MQADGDQKKIARRACQYEAEIGRDLDGKGRGTVHRRPDEPQSSGRHNLVRHDKFIRLDNGEAGVRLPARNPRLPAKRRNLQGFASTARGGPG